MGNEEKADLIVRFLAAASDSYNEDHDHPLIGPLCKRYRERYGELKRKHDFTTSYRMARKETILEILSYDKE
jgi:hypothetical protein